MKFKFFSFILSLALIITASGCTTTTYNETIPSNAQYALATMVNSGPEGVILDYQKDENTPVKRLVAVGEKADLAQTPIDSRVLIAFTYKQNSSSTYGTEINLYYLGPIFNGNVTYLNSEQAYNFSTTEVTLESIWLTGDFLNMALTLNYTEQMKLSLVCDEATADSACPVLYLIFEPDNLASGFPHSGYASFNVSSIWEKTTASSIKVVIKDEKTGLTLNKEFNRPSTL